LRLAARLLLEGREELALRLLGREAGDRLELALLLLEGRGEAAFLLAERLLARAEVPFFGGELGQPPLELVKLPGEPLLLGEHALLDLLDLALATARCLLGGAAGLEGGLLCVEVSRLAAVVGVALGPAGNGLGARPGLADLSPTEPPLEDESHHAADDFEDRVATKPKPLHFLRIGGSGG